MRNCAIKGESAMAEEEKRSSAHAGHRARMKQRFLRYGLDNFDDHNVLELLLFYAQPRQDTNAIAHRLLDTFGDLAGVFAATPEELMTVSGIKENAATLIRLVAETGRRSMIACAGSGTVLDSVQSMGEYLLPRFLYCRVETVYLVCLDCARRVTDCCRLGEGGLDYVRVDTRKIVQTVLMKDAAYVVLAHNHTNGIALPSHEDIETTKYLQKALEPVGVRLLDHIVVAAGDFVSLAQSGLLA